MSEINTNTTVAPTVSAPEIGSGTNSFNGENANQQPIPETGKDGIIGAIMTHGMMFGLGYGAGQVTERHRAHKDAKRQKKEEKAAEKAAKPKKRIHFQLPWSVEEYVEVPAEEVKKGEDTKEQPTEAKAE
jgi:hypothetical protein